MNLSEALAAIAAQLNLDAGELEAYAKEDYFTGWDNGAGMFPIGSLFGVEGQILYALVRATKAQNVLELGTQFGASTAHIALALHANGGGKVTSVDIQGNAGSMIPDDLRAYVDLVHRDAIEYLRTVPDYSVDILFEDLWHSSETCEAVGLASKRVLAPSGLLLSHDIEHHIVGANVRAGYDAAKIEYEPYLIPPSDCGLMVARPAARIGTWRNELVQELNALIEADKPKRTRKARTAK